MKGCMKHGTHGPGHLFWMVVLCALPLLILAMGNAYVGGTSSAVSWALVIVFIFAHIVLMRGSHAGQEENMDKKKRCH